MGGQFGEAACCCSSPCCWPTRARPARRAVAGAPAGAWRPAPADPQLAERLARIAERIEGIAQTLDMPSVAPIAAPAAGGRPGVAATAGPLYTGGAARCVRQFIPGANKHPPGAGSVRILVRVPGAHLQQQVLGG